MGGVRGARALLVAGCCGARSWRGLGPTLAPDHLPRLPCLHPLPTHPPTKQVHCSKDIKVCGLLGPASALDKKSPLVSDQARARCGGAQGLRPAQACVARQRLQPGCACALPALGSQRNALLTLHAPPPAKPRPWRRWWAWEAPPPGRCARCPPAPRWRSSTTLWRSTAAPPATRWPASSSSCRRVCGGNMRVGVEWRLPRQAVRRRRAAQQRLACGLPA